jgi:hypothetical protein
MSEDGGTAETSGGFEGGLWGSALIKAVGTLDVAGRRGPAGPLRSWVIGWTHRFDARGRGEADEGPHGAAEPVDPRDSTEFYAGGVSDSGAGFDGRVGAEQTPPPAVVRRLVEAVVDVLLERRSAEQVRRWVSREVFGLLSTVAQRRASIRFAARSTVRSIRLHTPALDAVESTVLVQDGPRVRAVALRFERSALPTAAQARFEPGRHEPLRYESDRLEWRCTALQFA